MRTGGETVIRQAISCDICGTEKKQTNHWFVAYDQGGELRVSGWNSRNRLRPGSKHLCGQTCLHKLVDDFMARALTVRAPRAAQIDVDDEFMDQAVGSDSSLTSDAAYREVESSARLIPTPHAGQARAAHRHAHAGRRRGADRRCRAGFLGTASAANADGIGDFSAPAAHRGGCGSLG